MSKVYDLIHQRADVADVISTLKTCDLIDTRRFVEEFDILSSRNPYYAKRLVKALTDNSHLLDSDGDQGPRIVPWNSKSGVVELSDWAFEQYVQLLPLSSPSPTFTDIIRYRFSSDVAVDVQEQPYLLCASGTTGFRTWEAALYLAEYLVQNQEYYAQDRFSRILELGAGTGLVSLVWSQLFQATMKELYVTDGDSTLVEQAIRYNFQLNNVTAAPANTLDCQYKFQRLWWGEDVVPDVDIVLAADVTYDASVVPSLVNCIVASLKQGAHHALIAATVRNENTTMLFERECEDRNVLWSITSCKEGEIAPIRIYLLRLPSQEL